MAHGLSAVKEMYLDDYADYFSKAGLQAITYAQTLPEVDSDRVGVLGSSFSSGHVEVVAAYDKRVRCCQLGVRAPLPPELASAVAHLRECGGTSSRYPSSPWVRAGIKTWRESIRHWRPALASSCSATRTITPEQHSLGVNSKTVATLSSGTMAAPSPTRSTLRCGTAVSSMGLERRSRSASWRRLSLIPDRASHLFSATHGSQPNSWSKTFPLKGWLPVSFVNMPGVTITDGSLCGKDY